MSSIFYLSIMFLKSFCLLCLGNFVVIIFLPKFLIQKGKQEAAFFQKYSKTGGGGGGRGGGGVIIKCYDSAK